MTIVGFVMFAAGAALVRWQVTVRSPAAGTLGLNVLGAWTLGFLHARGWGNLTVLGTAGLGALTTVSGLASVTAIIARRRIVLGAAYVGLSLMLGVGAAWWGLQAG